MSINLINKLIIEIKNTNTKQELDSLIQSNKLFDLQKELNMKLNHFSKKTKENQETKKIYPEFYCYKCEIEFDSFRSSQLHQWEEHPSNKYEVAWANNPNKTGFYADDPYY